MAVRSKPRYEGFGFCPQESVHHFVVTIPAGNREKVLISEHFTYDENEGRTAPTFGPGQTDGKLRVVLARDKWNAIADEVRVELNRRLKKQGLKTGQWKTGVNPLSRLFGKEVVLLAWAIEDADPALIMTAIKNWLGLVPEERWWLFTMTNAATGHAIYGRGKGWRKAVRFALTENPVADAQHAPLPVFRLEEGDAGVDYEVDKPERKRRRVVKARAPGKTV